MADTRSITVQVFIAFMLSTTLSLFGHWAASHLHVLFPGMLVLSAACIYLLKQLSGWFLSRILALFRPLLFLPIFIFCAVELAFYVRLHFHHTLAMHALWLSAFAILMIANALRVIRLKQVYNTNHLLARYLGPGVVLTYLLFTVYQPLQTILPDWFELSNAANAQMRFWHFHEWPYIHFMSSHLMSEQWYGYLYHALFGYQANYDFLVYAAFDSVLLYGVLYVFGLRVFQQPSLTVLFLLCFPFLRVLFPETLMLTAMLFYFLIQAIRQATVKRYLTVIICAICLLVWRLDLGSAGLSMLLLSGLFLLIAEKKWPDSKVVLKSTAWVVVAACLVVSVIFLTRSSATIYAAIENALHYIGANQAHGYAQLSRSYDQQFYFFYFLVPLISILLLLFLTYAKRAALRQSHYDIFYSTAVFFLTLVLVNFQRGLVRHGFMEYNDSYLSAGFYAGLAASFIYFGKVQLASDRYTVFFAASFLMMITFTYFPMSHEAGQLESMLKAPSLENVETALQNNQLSQRVTVASDSTSLHLNELKVYLNKALKPDQTFLDFSNTPILYYVSQRKVPSYFCQSLQNSVDEWTQQEQIRQLDTTLIPLVVFSNDPPNWFDATDDVPNTLRYSWLAEYIFTYYQPYCVVSGKQIWKIKPAVSTESRDTVALKPMTHNYHQAALRYCQFFEKNKGQSLQFLETITPIPDSQQFIRLNWSGKTDTVHPVLMKLVLKKGNSGEIKFQLMQANQQIGTYSMYAQTDAGAYLIRLSNQYAWFKYSNKYILASGESQRIQEVQFFTEIK